MVMGGNVVVFVVLLVLLFFNLWALQRARLFDELTCSCPIQSLNQSSWERKLEDYQKELQWISNERDLAQDEATLLAQRKKHEEDFHKLAEKCGTDKTVAHAYQAAYVNLLEAFRGRKLKVLEIGLGCGMARGPGKSICLWKNFLGSRLELHIAEYDGGCASSFGREVDKLFVGDQGDVKFLHTILNQTEPYDVIIDDGGHYVAPQLVTLRELFNKGLKKGGLYIIEDLQTSYIPHFGGGYHNKTTLNKIKQLIDGLHSSRINPHEWVQVGSEYDEHLMPYIESIHCWAEICAFYKKWH